TNIQHDDLSYVIQKLLLYDPSDPSLGAFRNEFMRDSRIYGRTGLGGFDILRRRGITLPPGSAYEYIVEPGDTLFTIAAKFNSAVHAIAEANSMSVEQVLQVGQSLIVPVNISIPIDIPATTIP
ncbi:MAG: LysM peptidoglycan-binding domain-containing protein, partial [Anaerolineales bacterium]